jgi:hypothetical protein
MQINGTTRHARLLIEKTIEGVKELQASGVSPRFDLAFSITMQPGEITDSEALSWLAALEGACSKFNSDAKLALNLNLPVKSDVEATLLSGIEGKMQAAMQLEQSAEAAKNKLVGLEAPRRG